jgi:hypothetical protein
MQISLHHASKDLKRNSDAILIMGDGNSLITDMNRFLLWDIKHDVGALGRGVKEYPGAVQHWFNADGETAIHWAQQIAGNNGTITHTFGKVRGFDADWDIEQDNYHHQDITGDADRFHGSSALFATLASLKMGYRRVILAGCPMDCEGHYYWPEKNKETLGPIWLGYDFQAWLDFSQMRDANKVRSLSGYTKIILGEANEAWLNDAM